MRNNRRIEKATRLGTSQSIFLLLKMYYSCSEVEKDEMDTWRIPDENGKLGRPNHRREENIRRISRAQQMIDWDGLILLRMGKNNFLL